MCKTGKKINKINFNEFLLVLLENEKNYIYIYIYIYCGLLVGGKE